MTLNKITKECPLCKGSGVIEEDPTVKRIKELRASGLSVRAIGKLVNRCPSVVFHHINKEKNGNN